MRRAETDFYARDTIVKYLSAAGKAVFERRNRAECAKV